MLVDLNQSQEHFDPLYLSYINIKKQNDHN